MKTALRIGMTALAIMMVCQPAMSQKHTKKQVVSPRVALSRLIEKKIKGLDVGVEVQDLKTGKILYARNAKRLFTPASTLKLFTATAAVLYLKPDFRFNTRLVTGGRLRRGRIVGDTTLVFSGDPTLKNRDLSKLFSDLRHRGVKKLQGDLYLDDTVFDQKGHGPGWMWDEVHNCYAAPVSGINLDENCFNVSVRPGKKEGAPAALRLDTVTQFFTFKNSTVTRMRSTYHECPLDLQVEGENHYALSGCISPNSRPVLLNIAIHDMRDYTKDFVTKLLKQKGITLTGHIKLGKMPCATCRLITLSKHQSWPLRDLVKKMLKESDNLIADALFKAVGAHYFKSQGTWHNAGLAVSKILSQHVNLDFGSLIMVDGAGLSRYNLVSPAQLTQVLAYIEHHKSLRQTIIPALPIGNHDGTLKNRMRKKELAHRVRAKTGTMRSATALSGYVTTLKNRKLAFTIMVNDFASKVRPYQAFEDRICALLVHF